jgi:hypothetical protein
MASAATNQALDPSVPVLITLNEVFFDRLADTWEGFSVAALLTRQRNDMVRSAAMTVATSIQRQILASRAVTVPIIPRRRTATDTSPDLRKIDDTMDRLIDAWKTDQKPKQRRLPLWIRKATSWFRSRFT